MSSIYRVMIFSYWYIQQVKYWITHNEPWVQAWLGYGIGSNAPRVYGPGDLVYIAGHNLLKSHAESYHVYDDEFRPTQNGTYAEPETNLN